MKKNINRILVIIGALLLIIGSNSIWFNQYLNSDFQGSVRGIDRSEGNIFFLWWNRFSCAYIFHQTVIG